jgi:hypothetical protein
MSSPLTPEQQRELDAFPPVLRALIEAELASGNTVVEVGHSFPAPPAGAYFKLAKKVSTRPRVSGNGLDFYEYNSSIYSGQFTDSKRFYFVIEPPNPPPPEPDMDAIRKSESRNNEPKWLHANPAPLKTTATSATFHLHFSDTRTPQEIRALLERDITKLFSVGCKEGRLIYSMQANFGGAKYNIKLRFEAALPRTNAYSLLATASWNDMPKMHYDYFQKTVAGWIGFWTRDFKCGKPAEAQENLPDRYADIRDAALRAESHLASVADIQQAIVAAMKRGATFSTAHKEGGTIIKWSAGRFIRSDYGDDPDLKEYADETEFLKFLRQFYDWQTSAAVYPNKVSDFEAWMLILRKIRGSAIQ